MSGRNRRTKERRHRRMDEAREKVCDIKKSLEIEKDEVKIKKLKQELEYWRQFSSRKANQL